MSLFFLYIIHTFCLVNPIILRRVFQLVNSPQTTNFQNIKNPFINFQTVIYLLIILNCFNYLLTSVTKIVSVGELTSTVKSVLELELKLGVFRTVAPPSYTSSYKSSISIPVSSAVDDLQQGKTILQLGM